MIRNIRVKSPSLEVQDEDGGAPPVVAAPQDQQSGQPDQGLSQTYHLKESAPLLYETHRKLVQKEKSNSDLEGLIDNISGNFLSSRLRQKDPSKLNRDPSA